MSTHDARAPRAPLGLQRCGENLAPPYVSLPPSGVALGRLSAVQRWCGPRASLPPSEYQNKTNMRRGLGGVLIAGMVGLSTAGCPRGWTENPATSKCYRLATWASGFHWQCAALCGKDASLACITSAADNAWLASWVNQSKTYRNGVWIGHYQDPIEDEKLGWTQCSNGRSETFTNWFKSPSGCTDDCSVSGLRAPDQPNEDYSANRERNPVARMTEECAALRPEGWFDERCAWRQYYCLCEHGTPTSSTYEAWVARNRPTWLTGHIQNATIASVIAVVIAIFPVLVLVARNACSDASRKPWAQRVRARVQHVFQLVAWISIIFGITAVALFIVSCRWASCTFIHPIMGHTINYSVFIVLGCFAGTLAILPGDARGVSCALPLHIAVYALDALLGLYFLVFWGWWTGNLSYVIFGLLLFVASLLCVAAVTSAYSKTAARDRLDRMWLVLRLFHVILFVNALIKSILNIVSNGGPKYDGGPWMALSLVSLACSVIATPRMRLQACQLVATLGRCGKDYLEAKAAAKIIWLAVEDMQEVGGQAPAQKSPEPI